MLLQLIYFEANWFELSWKQKLELSFYLTKLFQLHTLYGDESLGDYE